MTTAVLWSIDPLIVKHITNVSKGKGFPYSLPSVGPGADPGVQAVSPQVTISRPPGGRLPSRSARPAVTFPAAEYHVVPWPVPSYTAWWQRHIEQLAQGCYAALPQVWFERWTHVDLLPTLKYRRYRGDMIELFKIVNGKYDSACIPHFEFMELSDNLIRTRGKKFKLV